MTDNVTSADAGVLPVSVVIATLGGDVLIDTILHLNRGEGTPREILICIPEAEAANADCVATVANVKIIKSPYRGQVAQRAVGLAAASEPFVMQVDDDVILPTDTLKILWQTLLDKGPGNVVAPFFRIQPDGRDGTSYIGGLKGIVRDCHASLVCGAAYGRARLGRISPAGIGFGVPMTVDAERVVESEWLPGGVAMCHKDDLIIENYYPFSGKAFSEDLIHSILWRRRGCRLWTVLDVSAMIDVTVESFDWRSARARYAAHAYVAGLSGGSVWRTKLWFACYCLANARRFLAARRVRQPG